MHGINNIFRCLRVSMYLFDMSICLQIDENDGALMAFQQDLVTRELLQEFIIELVKRVSNSPENEPVKYIHV